MKSIIPKIWSLCIAALAAALTQTNPTQQALFAGEDTMAEQDDRVTGHNNAYYDTVPKEDQIFKVEFLEVAPTPIKADRVFFMYLRGYLPDSNPLGPPDEGLVNATLKVSSSAIYPDGSVEPEGSGATGPFKTTSFHPVAHLTIRNATGYQVDYMPSTGYSEIVIDFQIINIWLKTGMWTFKVDARAGDINNTCLFAGKMTQWLEGWRD